MNQCPYCNVNISKGYVGEVELESHLKEIHEVSFETMHEAEAWWDKKYVPFGRPSWADMNIGQRRQTINAYLTRSPSTEMRGFLKCPKCGITFNDSENTDDELTIHLMKEHQVPEDLAEEITTFEVGSNESKANEGPLQRFYCLDCDWEGNRNYDAIVHETEFQTHNVDERYIDESKANEDMSEMDYSIQSFWDNRVRDAWLADDHLKDPDYTNYIHPHNNILKDIDGYNRSEWVTWYNLSDDEKEAIIIYKLTHSFESKAKEDYYNLSSDDYDDMIDEEPDDPDPESVLPDEYYDMKNHDKLNFGGDSKASEIRSTVDYFDNKEIEGKDILTCTICGQDFDEQEFGLEDAKIHLRSFHGINNTFESKAGAPWQKNADLESLASEFEIKDLQEDSKMTDEGFVDKIDMLANKMGVNLDRDPEQVESVASEDHSCLEDEDGDCICDSCDTDQSEYGGYSCKTCKNSKGII